MSSNSSSMPRLGPAWRSSGAGGSGRGFQPPPAVPDDTTNTTRDRSGSHASGGTAGSSGGAGGGVDKNRNPFSLLDEDEDGAAAGAGAPTASSSSSGGGDKGSSIRASNNNSNSRGPPAPTNDRFSALKSTSESSTSSSSRPYNRSASSGPRVGGRSLADLAAGLSSTSGGGDRDNHHHHHHHHHRDRNNDSSKQIHRSSSTGLYHHSRGGDSRGGGITSDMQRSRSGSSGGGGGSGLGMMMDYEDGGAKIIRFTREKLLSLRPRPMGNVVGLPDVLKHLEGSVVISSEPQDPVCWDTFDADEIWSLVARERRTSERGPPPSKDEPRRGSRLGDDELRGGRERRGTGFSTGGGGGRWQRGMTIPESDRGGSRSSRNDVEADNPDDLWDDPTTGGGTLAAAADFSAFGGSLEDDHPRGKTGMDAFELTDMSKAAAAFEAEMDDDRKDDNGNGSGAEDNHNHSVDSSRPLAGSGTTIRSGSGNDVSVFEDFDEPAADVATEEVPIKGGNEANAASSRLMQMIGVSGTGEASSGAAAEETKPEPTTIEKAEAVPSNPWGAPAVSSNPWGDSGGLGTFGSQANETDAAAQQREEEARRRQQEEEKKRWEAMQAKQQADLQAQQQQQQQLRQQQQDQVENVLMERVSNILENSWGKSDLNSILSTLHAEDSRVIAILSTIDQLRALISRHPQRIQLGTEGGVIMAQLRLNNQQWQVAQAQIAQAKALQEQQELQRRRLQEEQLRQQQAQQAAQQEALARARAEQERQKQQVVKIDPNAPWFYADPQGNIQGPFGGDEMKQWLEAGYFKGDLPISQNNSGPFRPLASFFSDPKTAFQSNQSGEDKAAAEAEARAQAEAEAAAKVQAAKEAEERRRVEEAAKLAAEEEKRKAAEAAELQQQADQSAQLKMMLGLGGGTTGIAGPPQPEPEPAAVEQPTKKQQKKKAQQKQPVEEKKVEKVAPAPEPAAPPAPAWGGGAASVSRKKSMSEIQQEEAKEAARRAKEQGGRPSGGGWANIAATGGSTAWGGAAAAPPTAAVVTPMPVVAGVTSSQKINANAAWNMKQAAAASAPSAATKQAQKAAAVDNFGANGQMSPSMEKWCKDQMQKLNGSDDLTLVTFCMTLTDSDEIRQYLSAYLGSTPQVNNFATEFIKRKGGDNSAEWESAGGPKKGRKKKGGK